jgi:hypothetical protein
MTPTRLRYLFLPAFAASLAATTAPVHAQPAKDRTVEQYLCKDVMRESGADRDVAIAFLHGFLLGKTGKSDFNVDILRKQSDQFIEACLAKPNDKAIDIMAAAKN